MQGYCEWLNGAQAAKRYDRDWCEASDYSNCEQRTSPLAKMNNLLASDAAVGRPGERKSPGQRK
jgi:hypothetical protein